MTLKCAPETEVEVYRQTLDYNLWPEIAHADVPAIVLRGLSKEGLASTTSPELAGWLPQAEDRPLPQASHHVPMEYPEEVVRAVRDLLLAPRLDRFCGAVVTSTIVLCTMRCVPLERFSEPNTS